MVRCAGSLVAAVVCVACSDDGESAPSVTPTFRESTEASELASLAGALQTLDLGDEFAPWALDFRVRAGGRDEVHRLEASDARLESQVLHSGDAGVVATTYYQALLPEPLPPIVLDVITAWRTNPRGDGLVGTIEVQLDERQPPEIYLAAVEFPRLALPSFGANDRLVLPWGGGYVVEDPISQPFAIDPPEPGFLSFPAMALIDGESGAHVYLSNDDRNATRKRVQLRSDPVRRELRFSVVQYPAEPWVQSDYVSPYAVEIALGRGDWFEVATRYNAFLAESLPQDARRALDPEPVWFGEFRAAPGALLAAAVHTDALAREFGSGLVAWQDITIPGGPGRFPPGGQQHGVPAYAAARARATGTGAVRLGPWVEGSLGRDPESLANAQARARQSAAVVRLEDGSRSVSGRGEDVGAYFCPASEWWASKLPETVAAFDEASGLDAVFLGNFGLLGSCFDATHDHPPGHGSWFAEAKLAQLERIAAALTSEEEPERVVPIAIEGLVGCFAERADLMFLDPFKNTTPLAPTRVHSVPLFRVAFDGVRLATLGVRDDVAVSRTGELAYQQAFRCVQAGLMLSTGRSFARAGSGPIAGEDAAYRRYLRSLATLIDERGFGRFHRGQLGRTPRLEIDGIFSARSDSGPLSVHTPNEMQLLPLGFYGDRDSDECAFVITNPWIGPCPLREGEVTVDYVATVELGKYPELADRFLVRELVSLGGSSSAHVATYGEELRFVGRLGPGETHFWKLTPTRERR